MSDFATSDLARKLGLVPGRAVCLLDAPPGAEEIVRAASPPGVVLTIAGGGPEGPAHEQQGRAPEGPAYERDRERSLRAFTPDVRSPGVHDREAPGAARYDEILFWPRTLDGLTERLSSLQRRIVPDGAVWLIMPKQAHARARCIAFTWDEMQAAALLTDLVDNKIASFSATDYATRFVIRKERRAAYT